MQKQGAMMAFVMAVWCMLQLCSLLHSSACTGFVWQSVSLWLEYKGERNIIIVCFLSINASPQGIDFVISKY